MNEIRITTLDRITSDDAERIADLVAQLSPAAEPSDRRTLDRLAASPDTLLFAATVGGRIVGTTVLALYPTLTGLKAWIEDVVVDSEYRGRGVARQLVERATEEAAARGAKTVDLTSHRSRAAAHRLYRRCGFEERDTTAFRLKLRT